PARPLHEDLGGHAGGDRRPVGLAHLLGGDDLVHAPLTAPGPLARSSQAPPPPRGPATPRPLRPSPARGARCPTPAPGSAPTRRPRCPAPASPAGSRGWP